MAMFLILFAVFCTRCGVQSLMEFPDAVIGGVGSAPLGLSLHGPVLDMESLASHAEGALNAFSNSMGIPFSKSKTKTDIRVDKGISSPQARPSAWISQAGEAKPTPPHKPPCNQLSSDQKLSSHKLAVSSSEASMYHPSSNTALPLIPLPSKVDISSNQQYISLPKVDISTNDQEISSPEKELNSNRSSNVQVNSFLVPTFPRQQSAYAVNENPDNTINSVSASATSVPLGVNSHRSIPSLYKQPQVSSSSGTPLPLSGPPYPAFRVPSIANTPSPYVPDSVTSHTFSSSPKGPMTIGYVVPPVSLPHMVYAVHNHSEIPLTETQVKVNSHYPNQLFPPYTYFPVGSYCHHSKANLPPLSGSVLPHPFTVMSQPHQHLTPAVPYYAASHQTHDADYMPQPQQDYYYSQNEDVHHAPYSSLNFHRTYNSNV